MWRKPFLLGMLCGTLMTAGLLLFAQALPSTRTTPGAAVTPLGAPTVLVKRYRSQSLPLSPRPLPRGWHAYPFNGQTVYLVPLSSSALFQGQ